jgi:hypothetical protein
LQRSNALLVFSTVIGLASLAGMGGLAATGCNGGSSSTGGEPAGTQAQTQPAAAQPATQPAAAQPAAEQPATQPPAATAGTTAAAELAPIETDPRKADLALLCRTLVACWQEDQASGGCRGEELHTRLRGLAIKLSENRDLREHLIAGNGQGPAVDELGKQLQQYGVACQLVRPAAPAEGAAAAEGTQPAEGAAAAEGAKPTQEPTPPPAP